MACACSGKNGANGYVWISSDGTKRVDYRTEVEARARVIREGGTFAAK